MIRAFLAVLLTAISVALLSPSAVAAPAADSDITIQVSNDAVRLGKRVSVTGEGPGLRRLVLQLKTRENGWQDLAAVTTGAGGSYSFRAPGWSGTHRLRVVAPPTLDFAASVSDTRRVTVRMPYHPRGADVGLDLAVAPRCPMGPVPDDHLSDQLQRELSRRCGRHPAHLPPGRNGHRLPVRLPRPHDEGDPA